MKNKLIDLNDDLFAQLERLSDEETKGEDLLREIERSKAITGVAAKIIDGARLALDAQKELDEGNLRTVPLMIGAKSSGGAE